MRRLRHAKAKSGFARVLRGGIALGLGTAVVFGASSHAQAQDGSASSTPPTVGDYYKELQSSGNLDIDSGSRTTLITDLRRAEALLRSGAYEDAAVALYAIVESPRYEGLEDFVEFQNSQYYLGVALSRSGAYEAALAYLLQTMTSGPSTLYFAPAHRKAVDIALTTKRPKEVLAQLEGLKLNEPVPPGVSGERAYLRARGAYEDGDLAGAEAELVKVSRKSRLYSSALYLRGVIRTRNGQFSDAAEAFCEISDTPDNGKYTFVVDERYFRIKDLARLGLARIAHETDNYDNAYYHYFQIPEDSDKLGDALFESAWSMYQKRELPTSRDLVKEFIGEFPNSPLVPEARLLAGYVELADCEFTDAQRFYDELVNDLGPIVAEIESIRENSKKRSMLFDKALKRWRAERAEPDQQLAENLASKSDRVLALLRFNEGFVRVHEALAGLRRASGGAPHVVQTWQGLGKQLGRVKVRSNSEEQSFEEAEAHEGLALVGDLQRLRDQVSQARTNLRRAKRDGGLEKSEAAEETARLNGIAAEIDSLEARALASAEALAITDVEKTPDGLRPLVKADLEQSKALEQSAKELLSRLEAKADTMAKAALEGLYMETKRVLDKAKLGKIDAVIGQKRRLEIEVQDLAAGRFPAELHGQLWEQGLIGDDEEFWPFEGEYWKDEYEGWR